MAQSLHSKTTKPKVSNHSLGGKMKAFPNFYKDKDRKVRFDGGEKCVSPAPTTTTGTTVKQHLLRHSALEKPSPTKPSPTKLQDEIMSKNIQNNDPPKSGEERASPDAPPLTTVHQYSQEYRLKGKLKWLFEQDRMYWESNSAKSSRVGSPEVDLSKGSRSISSNKSNDAKLLQGVQEGLKIDFTRKHQPLDTFSISSNNSNNNSREQSCSNFNTKVSREASSTPDHQSKLGLPAGKLHWTPSNSAKVWPHGNPTSQPAKVAPTTVQNKSIASLVPTSENVESRKRPSTDSRDQVSEAQENTNSKSTTLDLGPEEFFSDYEDAPNSAESTETSTSDADEERNTRVAKGKTADELETKKNADIIVGAGDGDEVKELQKQAIFLKDKCETLCRERNLVVRKWKQSCDDMDQAASMAQTLRAAIETLLETGTENLRGADCKERQDMMQSQTIQLKLRTAKLGQKNSEGKKKNSKSLEDRIDTLKRNSEVSSLGSPEVPRDPQQKVEALKARLERLMIATNSQVANDRGQPQRRASEKRSTVDSLAEKSQSSLESGELKMKGWFNSLSAELSAEQLKASARGGFEINKLAHRLSAPNTTSISKNTTPIASKNATPSASKSATPSVSKHVTPSSSRNPTPLASNQASPLHPLYGKEMDYPGFARTREETKKKVIHKIAEEVRLETEQWFQVQDLLQRVGDDMSSLQEACSTWERRATVAEAQVVSFHQEGHQRKTKGEDLGEDKIEALQKEVLKLRETVEEVRKQVGSISIDPNRWFEAATHYGYAFMPVNLQLPCVQRNFAYAFKGTYSSTSSINGGPESSDHWRQKGAHCTGNAEPCSSMNSPGAPLSIVEGDSTLALIEMRQKSQLPSEVWGSEIGSVEEDIETSSITGKSSGLKFTNTIKELFPAEGVKVPEEFLR